MPTAYVHSRFFVTDSVPIPMNNPTQKQVVLRHKWLRMIFQNEKYSIQVRHWWKWKTITFAPYGPHTTGMKEFKFKVHALGLYKACRREKKAYALRGT